MPNLVRIMTQLDPAVHKELKRYAKETGVFIQRCYQEAITEFLDKHKRRPQRLPQHK